MHKRNDERLLAYLDGELEMAERREVEAWVEADQEAAKRLAAFAESGNLLRQALDEVIHEPLPERLISAARGKTATTEADRRVVSFERPPLGEETISRRRWRIAIPVAASVFGLLLGTSAAYYGSGKLATGTAALDGKRRAEAVAANNVWLNDAAGYFKLFVNAGDNPLVDVPMNAENSEALQKLSQSLPQEVRLPNLKPWGLTFRGARLIVVEGRPAAQLVYTTDNKAIGPLTLIIGSSKQPEISPTFARRQDVNLLYWRHQGRAYVLVGQTDIGYLWGIGNDVAWQLDAI